MVNKLIVVILGIVNGKMIWMNIWSLLVLLICVDLIIELEIECLKNVCIIIILKGLIVIGKINV